MFRWEFKVYWNLGTFFAVLVEICAVSAICWPALKVCAETCGHVLFLFPWAVDGTAFHLFDQAADAVMDNFI